MGEIRILDDARIDALLRSSIAGRLACCDHAGDGRPYLVPLSYGYDGVAIHAYSAPGRKIAIMRAQPLVTFEVDRIEADDRWESAIVEATYEEATTPDDRAAALTVVGRGGSAPVIGGDTIVFRLRITAWSGREETPG